MQNIQGSQDVPKIKDYLVRIIKNSNTHTHKKSSKLSSEYDLQKQTKEKKKRD